MIEMRNPHPDVSGGLREYQAKRNFTRTSEPGPNRVKKTAKAKKELLFVIQKHEATRLHYDFRLEMEGVLKSWAVPKGLPVIRGERRLAVHVEDHPFDYAQFEGTIAPGNYGAGTVMVWDIGTYYAHSDDPVQDLADGKLHLTLKGKKINGDWTLVRLKPRYGESKDQWLILKSGDDMKPLTAKVEDQSALTHRTLRQIASQDTAQWQSNRTAAKPAPALTAAFKKKTTYEDVEEAPTGPIQFIDPMKCKPLGQPPDGAEWLYEIKFDGIRALSLKRGSTVQMLSRAANDLTAKYPELAQAIAALPCADAVFDGEVVGLDPKGRSSFQLLQSANTPGEKRAPLCYYVFDLLHIEGKDLRGLPLEERKQILRSLIGSHHEPVRFSASINAEPTALLAEVQARGLEGIIAKKRKSLYEPGQRSGAWVKIKCVNEQEFVIGGFTAPQGSRDHFGALLVGVFEKGRLRFCSKVGTGFNHALLKSLHQKFRKLEQAEPPFFNLPERAGRFGQRLTAVEMKRCSWIEPRLLAQVRFTEWTRDGHLRHPVFMGLREDKDAREVVRET